MNQIPVLFKALDIQHPSQKLRDTAVLGARVDSGWTPSVKKLAWSELDVTIQDGTRSSVCQFFSPLCFIIRITIYRSRMLEQQWLFTGSINAIGPSLCA